MIRQLYFVGGVWGDEEEPEIMALSKGPVQHAANIFQNNLIKGLNACLDNPVTVVSAPFVGAFPARYRSPMVRGRKFNCSDEKSHIDYGVGFLNLPLIKHFCRQRKISGRLSNLISCQNDLEGTYICGYSMTYSTVASLVNLGKKYKEVKTCLIVPDLPEYMNLGSSRGALFGFLKSKVNAYLYELIHNIDCFVVLTKYMYPALNVSGKPYVVVEGIAPEPIEAQPKEENNIVYTGALDEKYGVKDLVDAFHEIEETSLRLIICGQGDSLPYIEALAQRDSRIQYKGTVSNEEARALQRDATLLVNPRSNQEEYTKYSFPSKTLEYMASGTPVLMHQLKGIPEEYSSYLYYIRGTLKDSLVSVLSLKKEERRRFGQIARRFVIEEKTAERQSKKIINLLESLQRETRWR